MLLQMLVARTAQNTVDHAGFHPGPRGAARRLRVGRRVILAIMKVSLRLSRRPALAGAVLTVLACLALLTGPALAVPAPRGEVGKLLGCRSVTPDTARLQCFDRTSAALARSMTAADATTPSKGVAAAAGASRQPMATQASSSQGTDLDPHQTFGLSSAAILAREVRSGVRQKSISSITARVTGLGATSDGRIIYDLDDGQTWRELEADGEAPPVKSGDRVQISRGWLDSYWLETASGRGCKVERLR